MRELQAENPDGLANYFVDKDELDIVGPVKHITSPCGSILEVATQEQETETSYIDVFRTMPGTRKNYKPGVVKMLRELCCVEV